MSRTFGAIDRHWAASAAGDQDAEHEIYHDDAVCEYPQSGEVIRGRRNLQSLRSHHPGKPSGFTVRRIAGEGNLWVTEYVITYQGKPAFTVSIMEFRDGKVGTRPNISPIRSMLRLACPVGRAGTGLRSAAAIDPGARLPQRIYLWPARPILGRI